MTFENAIKIRDSLGYTSFKRGGLTFEVCIVPTKSKEYEEYTKDFNNIPLSDVQTFKLSKTNDFQLVGLYGSAPNVGYYSLPIIV